MVAECTLVDGLLPDAVVAPAPVARPSSPPASAVERSRVDLALRALSDAAADDLSDPWPAAVHAAARSREGALSDALDRAVAGTDLGLDRVPRWSRVGGGSPGSTCSRCCACPNRRHR